MFCVFVSMKHGTREAGAELRSLGHQRAAPQWWRDSQNRATIEGRLFGGQGSGARLPPPSSHASLKQKHRTLQFHLTKKHTR